MRIQTKPPRTALYLLAVASCGGAPSGGSAQERIIVEPSPAPPGHLEIVVDPPPRATPPAPIEPPAPEESARAKMSEEEADRHAELWWSVLRCRKLLIGFSVATAVGAALVFPAEFTQCPGDEMSLDRCSPGGRVMVVAGYPLLVIGGLAMLSSGIVLGVTKGELRRLEQRVARRESRSLRWDPATARFVF